MNNALVRTDRIAFPPPGGCSQSIDWYCKGESRTVEAGGIRVTVRFVGRKGRRARIAITGPAGAEFVDREPQMDGGRADVRKGSENQQ